VNDAPTVSTAIPDTSAVAEQAFSFTLDPNTFVDVDPAKIGRTRRGLPILSPEDLPGWWERSPNPVVLAAVGARGARQLIRQRLESYGLREAQDWWSVA